MNRAGLNKNRKKPNKDKSLLLYNCEMMRERLGDLYSILDNVVEDELIDSVIYEIQAVNMRYHYYLRVCKERGYTA